MSDEPTLSTVFCSTSKVTVSGDTIPRRLRSPSMTAAISNGAAYSQPQRCCCRTRTCRHTSTAAHRYSPAHRPATTVMRTHAQAGSIASRLNTTVTASTAACIPVQRRWPVKAQMPRCSASMAVSTAMLPNARTNALPSCIPSTIISSPRPLPPA